MHPNDEYAATFATNFDALRAERRAVRHAAQDEWDKEIRAETKRRKLKKNAPLPGEYLESLRAQLFTKYDIDGWDNRIESAEKERESKLDRLAPLVTFAPSPDASVIVKVSSAYSYSSQTQPLFYAKGALLPLRAKLESLGIPSNVRYGGNESHRYELLSTCPEWMGDAAGRLIDLEFWKSTLEHHGLNVRVYNPFLPW